MSNNFKDFLSLLKEQFLDEIQDLTEETKLREIPGWDSMTGMTILLMIEEKYDIKIDNEDFKKLITVQDLFNFIN